MGHHSKPIINGNDTAKWGKDQNWAVVWFLSVVVIAPLFVSFLTRVDSWMYQSNGEVNVAGVKLLDYDKYRSNRNASFGIASERSDARSAKSLSKTYKELSLSK